MADFNSGRAWRAWASPGPKPITETAKAKIERLADENRGGLVQADRIGGWPKGFEYLDLVTAKDEATKMLRIVDEKPRLAFETAQREANDASQAEHPTPSPQVDPYLHMGGLYSRGCAYALEVATGEKVITSDPSHDTHAIHYGLARTFLYWDAEKVKKLAKAADWDAVRKAIVKSKSPIGILHSTKAFLDTCASLDYGIRFASD